MAHWEKICYIRLRYIRSQNLTAIISTLLLSTPVGGSVSHCPCLTDFIIISTITDIRNTYREISIIIIKRTENIIINSTLTT